VYVDGFNLYYGAVKDTPVKWLDLERYFKLLRPHDSIQKIKYYTALVVGPHRANQEAYWQALSTTPLVEIVQGNFKEKNMLCKVHACAHPGNRSFKTHEEKRTDVNIAIGMLDDAYQELCDRMILVSGDSDLVPVVRLVRSRFPSIDVNVYVPARHRERGRAVELRSSATDSKELPLNILPKAQFPPVIIHDGITIHKPSGWCQEPMGAGS
jgi:uncharacterized LabA/DUF88 family protein